jgi:hypothetical protein
MKTSNKDTQYNNTQGEKNSLKNFSNENETSHNMSRTQNQSDNLRVVIRVRPALPREMEVDLPFRSIVRIIK